VRKRPSQAELLTTSEAATLLDVSVATLKRWTEAGLFGPERTKGGHRRFSRAELEAFLHRPRAGEDVVAERADELLGASGPVEVEAFLLRSRAGADAWAEVADALRPSLIELHRRRRDGRLSTPRWLEALERLRGALFRLVGSALPSRGAARLLVVSVPGDRLQHVGALSMLVAAEAGWAPAYGGAVTAAELAPELSREPPAALFVTASVDADAERVRRAGMELASMATSTGLPVALAGLGMAEWGDPPPGAAQVRTYADLARWLGGLEQGGASPGASAASPRLAWDPSLALGDETLDAQHQVLFRTAGGFVEAARAGASLPEAEQLLRFVEDYAQVHFRYEEHLMRAHGYPHVEEHVWEHEQFARRLQAEKAAVTAGAPGAAREVAELLRSWLTQHVGGSDQRFAAHLRARRAG
jgi:hemerythrin-like metal-binding protein/excisionase family DNA binding protein